MMRRVLVGLLLLTTTLTAQQPDPAAANVLIERLLIDLAQLKAEINRPTPGGLVVRVPAGSDLQAALDAAQPGQTLMLAPATFTGNFILRKKAGVGVITIRTDGLDDAAIPPGVRVTPALSPRMAKLAPKEAAVQTLTIEHGAEGYTLIGLEFLPNLVLPDRSLILFGYAAKTVAELPKHITFDRVYVHGSPEKGGHNGCSCHGVNITFINGWWSDFWEQGRDSQAIGAYNGAGPYLIENNYLEASGENVMFGGADPAIPGLITSDIVIRRNHFVKPLAWKTKPGSVKNLFELKNAQHVLVEFNVFENVWVDAQAGNAIVFTPRNQDGGCPWCVVREVLFQHNVVKNVQSYAFNILGYDNIQITTQASGRITIRHNVIEAGRGFLVQDKVDGLTIDHNLLVGVNNQMFAFGGAPILGLVVTHNILRSGPYGITGDNTTIGLPSLTWCCTPYTFTRNAIERTAERFIAYPTGNDLLAPGTLASRLDAAFRYTADTGHVATDGVPLGPDVAALLQGLQGVAPQPLAEITP